MLVRHLKRWGEHISTMKLFNPDDPDLLRKFEKAIEKAGRRSLKSKRTARAALMKEGFITKSGRLTKRYGG